MTTAAAEPAGLWIRVSSGAQDEANQVPDVERHCADHGYTIARRYVVHAKSAFKGEHQGDLDAMLADMRAGVIRVLVIWHSDRIERRPGKALLDLLAEVSVAGGRVESVQEPTLGQLDFGAQVTTFIAGLVNSEKSRHISEQVGLAFDRIRENGGVIGWWPWGFEPVPGPNSDHRGLLDKHLVPTEEGRRLAPGIFQRVADGLSLRKVADWLEAETGRPWWARTVGTIIRNPAFRGVHYDEDGKTLYRCEAIVPAHLWKRANDALDAARTRTAGPPDTENTSLLSSLLRCLRCDDSPMYRIVPPGREPCYRCTGRGRNRKGCGNLVSLEVTDGLMNEAMSGLARPVTVREFIPGSNYDDEIEAITYELKGLAALELDEETEDQRRAELRAERKRLQDLPSVPDRWTEVETGETFGQLWERSTLQERRAWLRKASFKVYAGNPEMLEAVLDAAPDYPGDAFARMDWFTSGDTVLYFQWSGDDDEGLARGTGG